MHKIVCCYCWNVQVFCWWNFVYHSFVPWQTQSVMPLTLSRHLLDTRGFKNENKHWKELLSACDEFEILATSRKYFKWKLEYLNSCMFYIVCIIFINLLLIVFISFFFFFLLTVFVISLRYFLIIQSYLVHRSRLYWSRIY